MENNNKYEEALAKARKWYDANTNKGYRDIFEDIFPELIESDDEKWRNWLIGHLKGYINQTDNKYAEVCKKAISWLEKQGKKLPVDWNEKRKGLDELETYILSLDPNRSLDAVKVDAKNIRFLVNKDENKYDIGFKDGFLASEHNRKMTEEDIRHINNIIGCLEEFINPGFPIYKGGIYKEIKWLENLKNNK